MSSPYSAAEIAARDAMAERLTGNDSLTACIAGRPWRCWCGVTILRGEACVRIGDQTSRCHEECGISLAEAFAMFGPQAQLVDLDALEVAS